MNILLLMPRALYIFTRFAEACRRQGFNLTTMMAPNPPSKRYLVSFVNDTYENIYEIPTETDNTEAIAPLVQHFNAVVSGGEFSVVFAELLSERLGLFHNPLDRVESYRNKFLMRRFFAEYGVNQPKLLAKFESMKDVNDFNWGSIKFPVIAKPVDLSSSLYVRLCNDADSAKKIYQRIFKHSQSFSGLSFSAQGLLEEVAFGPEYSVECVVQDKEIICLFPTTKFVSPYPACDEMGHLSGEPFAETMADKVKEAVEGIVKAWGIESAVMHVEYKVCNGEVKVIEGACRIGGDMISELVELRYGVSLEECLVLLRCKLNVDRAFGRYSPNGDGYYYGIKYLFSENLASSTPVGIEVLRQIKNVGADHRPGDGFGVEKRLGHTLVRSRSLLSLKAYFGELSANVA